MIIVGLTGSIAMGKSTLAAIFRDLGVPVFDADEAVREVYRGESAREVEATFPGVTIDGAVDRERLSGYVVGDGAAMKRLEAIVHPAVAALRRVFLERATRIPARVAILDVPLLFETGGDRGVDVVLVVSARPEVQRTRALARPGLNAERFEALLSRQVADSQKRQLAHFVIETSGSLNDSVREAEDFLRAIIGTERATHNHA